MEQEQEESKYQKVHDGDDMYVQVKWLKYKNYDWIKKIKLLKCMKM